MPGSERVEDRGGGTDLWAYVGESERIVADKKLLDDDDDDDDGFRAM